jgi:hypothetical protein
MDCKAESQRSSQAHRFEPADGKAELRIYEVFDPASRF